MLHQRYRTDNFYIYPPDNFYIYPPDNFYIYPPDNFCIYPPDNFYIYPPDNFCIYPPDNFYIYPPELHAAFTNIIEPDTLRQESSSSFTLDTSYNKSVAERSACFFVIM